MKKLILALTVLIQNIAPFTIGVKNGYIGHQIYVGLCQKHHCPFVTLSEINTVLRYKAPSMASSTVIENCYGGSLNVKNKKGYKGGRNKMMLYTNNQSDTFLWVVTDDGSFYTIPCSEISDGAWIWFAPELEELHGTYCFNFQNPDENWNGYAFGYGCGPCNKNKITSFAGCCKVNTKNQKKVYWDKQNCNKQLVNHTQNIDLSNICSIIT